MIQLKKNYKSFTNIKLHLQICFYLIPQYNGQKFREMRISHYVVQNIISRNIQCEFRKPKKGAFLWVSSIFLGIFPKKIKMILGNTIQKHLKIFKDSEWFFFLTMFDNSIPISTYSPYQLGNKIVKKQNHRYFLCLANFANFAKFWVLNLAFREIPKAQNFVHCIPQQYFFYFQT